MEAGLFAGGFISNYYHQFYQDGIVDRAELDRVNPILGGRFAYFPHPMIGGEVEGAVTYTGVKGRAETAKIWGLRAHAVAQLPGRITPFAVLGLGVAYITSDDDVLGNDADVPLHIGAGAKFYATRRVVLRADLRLIRGPSSKDPFTLDASYGEFMFGVSVALGVPEEVITAVADPDPDGDGVLGAADACPQEAGTTADGCPTGDTDKDGLADDVDKCPTDAETVNAYEDDDGCPDAVPDRDQDGLSDALDTCPDQPEDIDTFEDTDGCPDLDNDGDGVTDAADGCPTERGPAENRGCADTDRDADGIVDRVDNCPDEAGTEANHGCKTKQLVVLTQTQLKILDKVYFKTNKAVLDRRSNRLLDNVASVLMNHPEIQQIRIEGHTDDRGPDEHNKQLSQERAESVASYLANKGVAPERMDAVGFGEEQPIATNTKESGRAQNRRVEFNIVDRPGAAGSDRSGSETVRPAGSELVTPP
jgi:outer membrane protein OmpA-like peptidoglycan-associated protein